MGFVFTDITLKNATDVVKAREGLKKKQEVREICFSVLVDTGAATMIISDSMRKKLGLRIRKTTTVYLANDDPQTVKIVDPVEVHWRDREMVCQPWVIPGTNKALLGAIPLEDMDLIVDPKRLEVTGRHGDKQIGLLVGVRPWK